MMTTKRLIGGANERSANSRPTALVISSTATETKICTRLNCRCAKACPAADAARQQRTLNRIVTVTRTSNTTARLLRIRFRQFTYRCQGFLERQLVRSGMLNEPGIGAVFRELTRKAAATT